MWLLRIALTLANAQSMAPNTSKAPISSASGNRPPTPVGKGVPLISASPERCAIAESKSSSSSCLTVENAVWRSGSSSFSAETSCIKTAIPSKGLKALAVSSAVEFRTASTNSDRFSEPARNSRGPSLVRVSTAKLRTSPSILYFVILLKSGMVSAGSSWLAMEGTVIRLPLSSRYAHASNISSCGPASKTIAGRPVTADINPATIPPSECPVKDTFSTGVVEVPSPKVARAALKKSTAV